MRCIYFFVLLQVVFWTALSAQRVERDSLWIQDIISNGGGYELTPETLEAIRNGSLLNTDRRISSALLAPSGLPIEKDFNLQILHLPNSGLLYQYEPDSVLIVRSAYIPNVDSVLVREYFRIPHTSIEIKAPGDDLFPSDIEVINGEWQGVIHARTFATFSAEDGLEDLFEPTERHKRENRKNANAWKTYNMQEMDE